MENQKDNNTTPKNEDISSSSGLRNTIIELTNAIDQITYRLALIQELSVDCEDSEMHLSKPATNGFFFAILSINDELNTVSKELMKISSQIKAQH